MASCTPRRGLPGRTLCLQCRSPLDRGTGQVPLLRMTSDDSLGGAGMIRCRSTPLEMSVGSSVRGTDVGWSARAAGQRSGGVQGRAIRAVRVGLVCEPGPRPVDHEIQHRRRVLPLTRRTPTVRVLDQRPAGPVGSNQSVPGIAAPRGTVPPQPCGRSTSRHNDLTGPLVRIPGDSGAGHDSDTRMDVD